jgi:calcineurin-like phosphoesterase family protein
MIRYLALMAAIGAAALARQARGPATPQASRPVTVIAYGDMRFTDPTNVTATDPAARVALVERIAEEHPDAVLLSGDVPWHGGTVADYEEYRMETASWRAKGLRVFPAIGNHEFSQCEPNVCIENWWNAFPEYRGRRWYSADVSDGVRVIALDTMSPLLPDSDQRAWLEHELTALPARVRFVIFTLHHPPVADVQTRLIVDHNPRPNEIALAALLKERAPATHARFVVVAGHVHNYERQVRDDVMYLVSGGGGAKPYEIDRTADDLYKGIEFPNFHYVKFTISGDTLKGEMYRLDEPSAPIKHFTLKDSFEVAARPE